MAKRIRKCCWCGNTTNMFTFHGHDICSVCSPRNPDRKNPDPDTCHQNCQSTWPPPRLTRQLRKRTRQ